MTAADALTIALLTATAFAATNLDNLLILVGMLGAGTTRRGVLRGYLAAAGTVLAICIVGGALGAVLEPGLVGYLGLVPLGMGLALGWRALRGSSVMPGAMGGGIYFLTLSNSGDSLALFIPLLAETERGSALVLVATYLLLTGVLAAAARLVAAHSGLQKTLAAWGRWLLPCVMIVVGAYILLDTATDTLV